MDENILRTCGDVTLAFARKYPGITFRDICLIHYAVSLPGIGSGLLRKQARRVTGVVSDKFISVSNFYS